MRSRRLLHVAVPLAGVIVTACGVSGQVAVERSDSIGVPVPGVDDEMFTPGDDPPATTDPGGDTAGDGGELPDAPAAPSTTAPADPVVTDPDAIDFGDAKPALDRDDFLLAAAADIEAWLAEEFEPAFGQAWQPLQGEIYAGYPQRTEPIPGCGSGRDTTPYDELAQFVAFYCPIGDFIAYDDGEGGLLDQLSDEFGPATIGIVLAHEYGHAIQLRTGALDRRLPTIITEQQADCVAGAWAGRAAAGEAFGVPFVESDLRASLIAMIQVQDPVGTDPTSPGGHGSGFDRVGAFQTGFQQGLGRCAELIDEPLPLTPLNFLNQDDFLAGGNAVFGFGETELFGFLPDDLNVFFDVDLDDVFPEFTRLTLVQTQSPDEVTCSDPVGVYETGAVLCPATDEVFLNLPVLAALYDEFGDFAPGYLLGRIWAEAAQLSQGSPLAGEERALLNDCLVGVWVRSATPLLDDNGDFVVDADNRPLTVEPRTTERTALLSPNDLTEAIQTAILIGDPSMSVDVIGSAFEKTDAFRAGVLDGLDAC